MTAVYNQPDLFFVIEIATPSGQPLAWYGLEQAVPKPCGPREGDRVYDQVRASLDDLEGRTGCVYKIRYWGSLEGRRAYVKHYNIVLS